MQGLLPEDDPDNSSNIAAVDESATGVIFENEVESNTIWEESCGSSQSIVNLSNLKGSD